MQDSDLQNPWNEGGDGVDTQTATGGPSWLPPGAVLNPDGSVTMPNGTVVPGPGPGYTRDPQTGVITKNPDAPAVPALTGPGAPAQPPKPTDPGSGPTPTPGPTGSTTTGLGSLFTPFGQSYTAPTPVGLPNAPTLNLPGYVKPPAFSYEDFQMPDANAVYQDPSYALRRDEGQRGIESSAAASGRVRTGGTLNDILKYNQGFASSEYGDIVDRKFKQYEENRNNAVDNYRTNYATQYVDPYTFDVQAAKDQFAPQMAQYQNQSQATQRQNELNTQTSWDQFLQKYREFDDDRKFRYGALSDQERIGLGAATA